MIQRCAQTWTETFSHFQYCQSSDFVAGSNISTNAKVGFDLSAFSAVIWAVWGEICMNLEKCFCFLFSFHLIQRAAHNLPLKSETLLRLCSVWRSSQKFQLRILISISRRVKQDLDSLFLSHSYLITLNIHDIFSYPRGFLL